MKHGRTECRLRHCLTFMEVLDFLRSVDPLQILDLGMIKELNDDWTAMVYRASSGKTVPVRLDIPEDVINHGKRGYLLGISKQSSERFVVILDDRSIFQGKRANIKLNSTELFEKADAIQKCNLCFEPALLRCKTCFDKFTMHTFYCCKTCQKQDWPKHKLLHTTTQQCFTMIQGKANSFGGLASCETKEIEGQNMLGQTPLMRACISGKWRKVEQILRYATSSGQSMRARDPNAIDLFGNSALIHAIVGNHAKCVESLLRCGPPALLTTNGAGSKALACAIECDNLVCCELIVRFGPKNLLYSAMEVENDSRGILPLYLACWRNRLEIVKFFLQHGDEQIIELCVTNGANCLWIASDVGATAIVELLIRSGGTKVTKLVLGTRIDTFSSALHQACKNGHLDVVRTLVAAGGKELIFRRRDIFNGNATTCLHIACQQDHATTKDIIELLILVGGNELLFLKATGGLTCLMYTLYNRNIDRIRFGYKHLITVLKFLLPLAGERLINAKSDLDDTLLDMARFQGLDDICALLVKYGAISGGKKQSPESQKAYKEELEKWAMRHFWEEQGYDLMHTIPLLQPNEKDRKACQEELLIAARPRVEPEQLRMLHERLTSSPARLQA
jgi:ankyrin repeat protein